MEDFQQFVCNKKNWWLIAMLSGLFMALFIKEFLGCTIILLGYVHKFGIPVNRE